MTKEECLFFLNGKILHEEYLLLEYWLSDRERNILGMKRKTFEIKSGKYSYTIFKRHESSDVFICDKI